MAFSDFKQRVKAHIVTAAGPINGKKIYDSIDEDTFYGYYQSDRWSDSHQVANAIIACYNANDPEIIAENKRKEAEEKARRERIRQEEIERHRLSTEVKARLERIKTQFPDIAIMNSDWADDIRFVIDCLLEGKSADYLALNEKKEVSQEKEKSPVNRFLIMSNIALMVTILLMYIFK